MKKDEKSLLKIIATIKWGKGFRDFKCKNCGHKKINSDNFPISIKCTKCDKIESAISGTAFQGSRLPIVVMVGILKEMREYLPKRASDLYLGNKFGITPKTVSDFLKRIAFWEGLSEDFKDLTDEENSDEIEFDSFSYRNRESELAEGEEFLLNLKQDSVRKYKTIYNIITWYHEVRPLHSILEILVTGDSDYEKKFEEEIPVW